MFLQILGSVLVLTFSFGSGNCSCQRDRNVQFQAPLYLTYDNGFFYIQGLKNGESVVIYKHPDDPRVFGQYTFKNERCFYETVYYYLQNGKYEFTSPFISDEDNFNITNKISFVKDGSDFEIEYNINPKGLGIFQNLGVGAEKQILPEPLIKKTHAVRPVRQIQPNFNKVGKQNLKVSYLKNGENYIQFVTHRNLFPSMEGQYTMRTSDRKYHTITYEIPLVSDYGMIIREYEISTKANFLKTGTISLGLPGAQMNVKYFVDSSGFHVANLQTVESLSTISTKPKEALQKEANQIIETNRKVRNQQRPGLFNSRVLNPTFSRPELLTGNRSVQPGK